LLLIAVAVACNGDDDDDAVETLPPDTTVAETAVPTTSEPPATTDVPTTSTTVEATTTTVDVEALKAEIAEDYLRSWELRRELTANPTLDGLDEKLAQISAPGSEDEATLRSFIEELVSLNERVVAGTPDEFRIDVEVVDVTSAGATVTVCFVGNSRRINAAGDTVLDLGTLAVRTQQDVEQTGNGWLPASGERDLWQGLGVTECPAA
jgi:hypothetical protein